MLNKEQYRTTLPRAIVIAGATFFIASVFIGIVFLTSGNRVSLLPPWQLFAVEMSCIGILLHMSLGPAKPRSALTIFLAAITISMALTALVVLFVGVGHTWNTSSLIGKTIAMFLSLSYPILLTTVAILIMRRYSTATTTVVEVAFGFCLLLTAPLFLVGLVLVCGFTGDCL